jgi:hypothetical protein
MGLPEEQSHSYKVMVDDNFHHMENGEQYLYAELSSCAEAVAACKKIVDDFLVPEHKPGMTAEELWAIYSAFGDDAFIVSEDTQCRFSGWQYARERCKELCGQQQNEGHVDE